MTNAYLIIALSSAGLLLSLRIWRNKQTKSCGRFCSYAVVGSKYSRTFGIENTLLGAVYYLFMAFGQTLPDTPLIQNAILLAALIALGFSLYLVGIQMFVIRKYCLLCLMTAFVNLVLVVAIVL